MTTMRLRIATCERCGSTAAVEARGDVGYCPYCPRPSAPAERRPTFRRWLLICALLGVAAGLLR